MSSHAPHPHLLDQLSPASAGAGPLLQRDYWAVIRASRKSPPEIASLIRERFPDFPPEELLECRVSQQQQGPLSVGDEVHLQIKGAGAARVRVMHTDANSITLGTMRGHPESGRITFGAYRNGRDDVIIHIRSRARSSSATHYAGFLAAGDPMQTNTWTDFIDRLAHTVGDGIIGSISADIRTLDETDGLEDMTSPTYIARGT